MAKHSHSRYSLWNGCHPCIFCRNSRNRDNSESSREGSYKSSSVQGKRSSTGGIRMETLQVTGGKMQATHFFQRLNSQDFKGSSLFKSCMLHQNNLYITNTMDILGHLGNSPMEQMEISTKQLHQGYEQ